MTDKDIQKLIDRYLEGTTSPEEERQLAHELLRPDFPEDWLAIRMMLGELAMGEAEYDDIVSNRQKQVPVIKRMYPRWMAAAASLLLIIGVGAVLLWPNDEPQSETVIAKVEKVEKQPCEAPEVAIKETPSPKATDKQFAYVRQTVRLRPTNTKKVEEPRKVAVKPVADEADEADPNLRYASHEEKTDTVPYQDPARLDDYIAKLAEANKVKEGALKCSLPCDSNVVSAVYVFPDKDEINLFGRLLQVACWYKSETPGYRLTFSNQQFFFELKDMRRQLHYHWIAERINGKVLFYATHAPLGTKVSSACYQEYCNELMHINSINKKPRKI